MFLLIFFITDVQKCNRYIDSVFCKLTYVKLPVCRFLLGSFVGFWWGLSAFLHGVSYHVQVMIVLLNLF